VSTATVYGVHPVAEALRTRSRPVVELYLAAGARGARLEGIEALARAQGIRIQRVDGRTLDRLAGGGVHQGVLARVEARAVRDLDDLLATLPAGPCTLVALDGVQDPHNLGAVVRNGALTGVTAVLVPKDRAAGVTPTVEKVAAGGLEHVAVVRTGNLVASLRRLKEEGFWIYGAAGDGAEDLDRVRFAERTVIVLGEEHHGLRRLTREQCDGLVRIPSTGRIDSYNLGVAAGILLFWRFLQGKKKNLTSPS
jgi:23S rRNA (guanosine2251-2'-O)-methyltransferase